MALLSESEVAEAPTSASGKLLKVQECALPGRTHAEGLWGGKKPIPSGWCCLRGTKTEARRGPAGQDHSHRGLRATTVSTSVCLGGLEHCRFGKSGETWECPIKHTFGI